MYCKKNPWKQLSLETTFLGKKFLGNKIPWSAVPWNDLPWKKISLLCRITEIFNWSKITFYLILSQFGLEICEIRIKKNVKTSIFLNLSNFVNYLSFMFTVSFSPSLLKAVCMLYVIEVAVTFAT
jgi:hypothetical protein